MGFYLVVEFIFCYYCRIFIKVRIIIVVGVLLVLGFVNVIKS
jgi:hypothetical protein